MKKLKIILIYLLLLFPFTVAAQSNDLMGSLGITNFGKKVNVIQPSPQSTQGMVANIINSLLFFLVTLFTVLIIYGGFRWMLSRGNSQQVEDAKNVIKNATIGLAIVVSSYVITRAIIDVLARTSSPLPPADSSTAT